MKRVPLAFLPSMILRGVLRWGPTRLALILSQADESIQSPSPAIIIRVDDFPRWDRNFADFVRFDTVMAKFRVPYVLGVIPYCEFRSGFRRPASEEEIEYLRKIVREKRVELALHGFTHEPRPYRGLKTEIALYDDVELVRRIGMSAEWFARQGLPTPEIFIPPFNTFTERNFAVLSKHFRVIMGASSTLSTFGKYRPQRHDGTIFLPSYGPVYGTSRRIESRIDTFVKGGQPYVIALHWAWESDSDYSELSSLLSHIVSRFEIWSTKQMMRELQI